jgi:hypothetical protein
MPEMPQLVIRRRAGFALLLGLAALAAASPAQAEKPVPATIAQLRISGSL